MVLKAFGLLKTKEYNILAVGNTLHGVSYIVRAYLALITVTTEVCIKKNKALTNSVNDVFCFCFCRINENAKSKRSCNTFKHNLKILNNTLNDEKCRNTTLV